MKEGFEKMYGEDPDGNPIGRQLPEHIYDLAESRPYQFWIDYKQDPAKLFKRDGYKFPEAADLRAACAQCLVWCEQHPLFAQKQFMYQGDLTIHYEPRKRVLTLSRLLDFLRMAPNNWHYGQIKRGEEFIALKSEVEQWIYQDKFEGVNAGFYNPSIIGPDLGLKTAASIELSGGKEPLKVQNEPISNEQLRKALEERGLPTDLLASFVGDAVAENDAGDQAKEARGDGSPEDFEAGDE